jgi:hypothetical protein
VGKGFVAATTLAQWQNLALDWRTILTRPSMTNAPTILVVEDEEDSILLLKSAFWKAEFSNLVHRVAAA